MITEGTTENVLQLIIRIHNKNLCFIVHKCIFKHNIMVRAINNHDNNNIYKQHLFTFLE